MQISTASLQQELAAAKNNPDKVAQIIGTLMSSGQGRKIIAASLRNPLKKSVESESHLRKALHHDPLASGETPEYEKDVSCYAYMVQRQGGLPVRHAEGDDFIIANTYDLMAYKDYKLSDIQKKKFDLPTRTKERIKQRIVQTENKALFSLLRAVVTDPNYPHIIVPSLGALLPGALSQAFALVAKGDPSEGELRVAYVWMNQTEVADVRTFGRDIFDFETQRELLEQGIIGTIWGATLIQCNLVPEGTVYVTCTPEHLGRVPERVALTILPADDLKFGRVGFLGYTNIGSFVHNPFGVSVVQVSRQP